MLRNLFGPFAFAENNAVGAEERPPIELGFGSRLAFAVDRVERENGQVIERRELDIGIKPVPESCIPGVPLHAVALGAAPLVIDAAARHRVVLDHQAGKAEGASEQAQADQIAFDLESRRGEHAVMLGAQQMRVNARRVDAVDVTVTFGLNPELTGLGGFFGQANALAQPVRIIACRQIPCKLEVFLVELLALADFFSPAFS